MSILKSKSNIRLINNKEIGMSTKIIRNEEIDASDLDGEKVMMNLDKGEYFMMNEVGSKIWDAIEEKVTVNHIIDELLSEYDVDLDTCKEEVLEFLGQLKNAELISIS